MPSLEHQGLAMLLLESPRLLVWLLRHVLGLELSDRVELTPGPETIRELRRPDHYADGVLMSTSVDDPGEREAFVAEIQLREDEDKHYTWALYVSGTATRLRCPTTLVVVTTSDSVERWCTKPIDIGRGRLILRPLVLGPSNIPREVAPRLARDLPELAVLAAIVHRRKPGSIRTIGAALDAVATLSREEPRRAGQYLTLLSSFAERGAFDMWMTKQMKMETRRRLEEAFEQRLYSIGHRQGRNEALGVVLAARGLVPTPEQQATIDACFDDTKLNRWLEEALVVDSVADLLAH